MDDLSRRLLARYQKGLPICACPDCLIPTALC
ncbi:hypothetical protein ACLBVL_29675, partial [Pseudomonas aeruginosa]